MKRAITTKTKAKTKIKSKSKKLTVYEVAAGLLVTFLTVYKWCKGDLAGPALPTIRVEGSAIGNRSIFVREDQLIDWLKENRPMLLPVWQTRHERPADVALKGQRAHAEARLQAVIDGRVAAELRARSKAA